MRFKVSYVNWLSKPFGYVTVAKLLAGS